MIAMLKRHEVQVLLGAGHTQEEVARLAGVSLRSVRRIAEEQAVTEVDDGAARAARRVGRPSLVEDFRKFVVDLLGQEPGLLSVEVLRRARLAGYRGGKSALYGLISSIRPRGVKLETRFEGLPGEFTQHDFGEVDVTFLDGRKARVHFFVTRLKYSRWSQVSVVPDERVERLVRSLLEHFAAIGGMPLLAVFDRPKTVALKWGKDGAVTEWNPIFAYAALEMGVGVEVCWPYSPEQKGSAENLVKWVKGSFFKQRRFHDMADLESQLREWLREVNELRPNRATGVTPAARLAEERSRLRPLKVTPAELALRVPVWVLPTAEVVHEGRRYSMPPEACNQPGTLFLYPDRVRIVTGRHEAEHPRKHGKGEVSVLPEHRAARLAEVHGVRGQRYLKRQDLLETGGVALEYLTEVIHRRPNAWYQEIDDLHALLQAAGPDVLRTAFARAVRGHTFGAEYIAHYVREALTAPVQKELPI
jgi:transposase